VTGLLDFGDILCSWQINEIAINMAYGMLKKEQPIVAASHLLVRALIPNVAK
jgi:Ser/Thr protein kinase RdoA (MazF antagonist)